MNEKDIEYMNRIKGSLTGMPYEALEHYDNIINNIQKELQKLRESQINPDQEKIALLESNLKTTSDKRKKAEEALNKIYPKTKEWEKAKEESIPDDLYQEMKDFLEKNEYEKESNTLRKNNKKVHSEITSKRDSLEKMIDKFGKDITIYQYNMQPRTLNNIWIDYDKMYEMITKEEKPKDEEKELEEEKTLSSNKIDYILENNKDITIEQKNNLEQMKIGYKQLEKLEENQETIDKYIKGLEEKEKYQKTKSSLINLKEKLEKEKRKAKELYINDIKDLNIDEMFRIEKELKEKERSIVVEQVELERMKNSDNYFANQREEFQVDKLDNLNNERQTLKEERPNETEEALKIPTTDEKIKELDDMATELGDKGYYSANTAAFQKYAIEHNKKTDLGSLSYSEYLKETNQTELADFQDLLEERNGLIYDEFEKTGMPINQFTQFAEQRYGIENAEIPESIKKELENNHTR